MSLQHMIGELEHELISTGKLIERVPADKLSWRPHPNAMSLGELALHVATIPGRYLGFAVAGNTSLETLLEHAMPSGKAEIDASFRRSTEAAKEILNNSGDWETRSWNLTRNGEAIFTLPLGLFTRLLVFNHLFHHRGQLSAYLRTLDVQIPSIYGPSGDENPFA